MWRHGEAFVTNNNNNNGNKEPKDDLKINLKGIINLQSVFGMHLIPMMNMLGGILHLLFI
jgi:hypothetical protein